MIWAKNLFIAFLMLLFCQLINAFENNLNNQHLLNSKETLQLCYPLTEQQLLEFTYQAKDPVYYRLFYHYKNVTYTLIAEQLVANFKKTLVKAPKSGRYCLQWHNPQKAAINIEYQIKH